jgi:RHS repeat-associated protein
LKTTDIVTNATGTILNESDFYPWGGELQFVNNDSNHYKFTGKERDGETQLDYFGARYYSNRLGRWISADWSPTPIPVAYADFRNPQSLNRYGYVSNMPTAKSDPDGHCEVLCASIVAAVVTTTAAKVGHLYYHSQQLKSEANSFKQDAKLLEAVTSNPQSTAAQKVDLDALVQDMIIFSRIWLIREFRSRQMLSILQTMHLRLRVQAERWKMRLEKQSTQAKMQLKLQ